MRIFTYLLLLAIVLLGLTFACLNANLVVFNYYIGIKKLPLAMLLVIAFALGCGLGLLMALLVYIRLKHANYKLKMRLKVCDKEIRNLRSIPLNNNPLL